MLIYTENDNTGVVTEKKNEAKFVADLRSLGAEVNGISKMAQAIIYLCGLG